MGTERRLNERYKVNFRARWVGKRVWREGNVTDISKAGCFILTEDSGVEIWELVKIELQMQAGIITLWGHVIYKAEEIGFGIRFSQFFHEDDRRKLELLVRAEWLRSLKQQKR